MNFGGDSMKTIRLVMLTVLAGLAAHADFSYITVTKSPAGDTTTKHYIKGQKLITDSPASVTIMDLDAQTMTTLNKTQKTYTVRPFSDLGKSAAASAALSNVNEDIKKTGQHQNINGFDAEEMVMTMTMDTTQAQRPGSKAPPMQMQMEMHFWFASDVPGINEMHDFYAKNADRMPWAAMTQGNASMAAAQRKMASMHGIPVRTVMKIGTADPQQQAKMDAARAQIEALKKQGGPQAAMADQMLARMGGGSNDVVSDSSGFSGAPVPDSVFAIPADYRKADR
jgi:hypothetical protein